ncbi:MAG: hypothetical protein JST39_11940 [Bacteroidetes bacterium]|nr:hypothetical protein [Bacteroidota bacterium]
MPEENFSQQDSLLLIESMIKKAKNRFGENGFLYLLWGWVILFCALGQYVLLFIVHSRYHYVVWMSTWLALIVQFIYIARKRRKKTVSTYTEEILRYVWITFVIMLFLFGFIIQGRAASDHQVPDYMISTTGLLALYGMPTFLSGIILRFRALILGGLGCWVLSVAAGFVPQQYQLLLVAAGVVMAWIVPGYMLRARYKKENELH